LGPQNKSLKTEVAKHKQELERLQQKVGHSLGFYTAVVACFVSHLIFLFRMSINDPMFPDSHHPGRRKFVMLVVNASK
jgi:hypothetical protein